jgi:formate dehydrogenase maturation protein FdhE
MKNIRDYGLGDADKVTGVPHATKLPQGDAQACPNCGGEDTVFMITVEVEHKQLRGGAGVGTYLGCAACPWASPCVMTAGASRA